MNVTVAVLLAAFAKNSREEDRSAEIGNLLDHSQAARDPFLKLTREAQAHLDNETGFAESVFRAIRVHGIAHVMEATRSVPSSYQHRFDDY
jgi:hypothetical protein